MGINACEKIYAVQPGHPNGMVQVYSCSGLWSSTNAGSHADTISMPWGNHPGPPILPDGWNSEVPKCPTSLTGVLAKELRGGASTWNTQAMDWDLVWIHLSLMGETNPGRPCWQTISHVRTEHSASYGAFCHTPPLKFVCFDLNVSSARTENTLPWTHHMEVESAPPVRRIQ